MMHQFSVPEFLWAEAIASSVYVHNRVFDKQSPSTTASEQIFKKKPTLGHLKVFCWPAFSQIPKEKRLV